MDEGNEHILFHFFDRQILDEVRADSPILLRRVENLIVDPSTARRLQQRMIEKEAEATAGGQNSCHFGNGIIDVFDVFEDETCHDCIEGVRCKRQSMRRRTGNMHSAASLRRDRDLIPRWIDTDHEARTETGCQARDLAVSTSHIENALHTFELSGCQRKDLLYVLGICTLGETFDPPCGVLFPQSAVQALVHGSRLCATTVRDVPSSLKFSLWPSPERDWNEIASIARYADASDWHGLWYADHFMPNTGDETIIDGNVHECWSMIAAITAVTARLRIGSLVSPTTVRHPTILANTAATIDNLGNGRLILGIGAGWQINEHHAYGIDLLGNRERVDRFEEAIQIMASLLHEDRTSFSGRHFTIADAPCQPRPIQKPLPILVGTGGPRMSRITAAHADEWNTWGAVSLAADRIADIRRACESISRDPASLRCSVQGLFFLVDDPSTAARIAEKAPVDRSVIGNSHQIAEALAAYRDLGYDEVIIPDFTLGATAAARLETYERFATEVIPLIG